MNVVTSVIALYLVVQSVLADTTISFTCNNVQYVYHPDLVDYATAARSCQAAGGALAAFDKDPSAWNCVESTLLSKKVDAGWMGLTRVGLGNQDFLWSDGKVATANDLVRAGKDISNFQGQEYCVQFWSAGSGANLTMTWNDNKCDKKFQYLCQFDNASSAGSTPKLQDPVSKPNFPTAKLNSCCNVNPKNWKATDAVVTYHTVPQAQLDYIVAAAAEATNTMDSPYDRCAVLQRNLTAKYPRAATQNGWYCVTGCGSMSQHGSYGWFTDDATFWFGDIKIEILRPQVGS